MKEYLNLLLIIAPVFCVIGAGLFLRMRSILVPEVEKGIITLVVKFLYPCLILQAMIRADSFKESPDSLIAPLVGFLTVVIGFLIARLIGNALGMTKGTGLRTFVFSAGIFNYGYIPIPLVEEMFGRNEMAALFLHNVGVEFAIWTVGVAMLAGGSFRDGIRKVGNPMVYALLVGVAINFLGISDNLPAMLTSTLALFAGCAIPLGLLVIGASLYDHLNTDEQVWHLKDCSAGVLVRLGVLPLVGLAFVWFAPLSVELKRILVVEAAMPAGMMPIVLAKHYGGRPIVAVRVVFATTIVGILTMPFWIRFGLGLISD